LRKDFGGYGFRVLYWGDFLRLGFRERVLGVGFWGLGLGDFLKFTVWGKLVGVKVLRFKFLFTS
jgi:hypothetical protein